MKTTHKSVLLNECIEYLNVKANGIYVDCTLGGAGHSGEIYKNLNEKGHLIGIDQDLAAIEYSKNKLDRLKKDSQITIVNDNFKNIKQIINNLGIEKVDGILADLGVSSFQLDIKDRGFSYQQNSALDMRMNKESGLTAEYIVNEYNKFELIRIIKDYGEEKWAVRIVDFIITAREKNRIKTTYELVEIIKNAIPSKARREGPHPAKRTFQAIRIEVNNELKILRDVIRDMVFLLKTGGRICIITFHSLEDRIVKEEFNRLINPCICPRDFPICTCNKKQVIKNVVRKPLIPSSEEVIENPRSRSAKLRVVEKL